MAVCRDYKIPHSVFAAWDRDDRDKALWAHTYETETCKACGTREDEWDPKKGGRDDAYTAELRKCWGCDAKAAAEKRITDDMGAGVWVAMLRSP